MILDERIWWKPLWGPKWRWRYPLRWPCQSRVGGGGIGWAGLGEGACNVDGGESELARELSEWSMIIGLLKPPRSEMSSSAATRWLAESEPDDELLLSSLWSSLLRLTSHNRPRLKYASLQVSEYQSMLCEDARAWLAELPSWKTLVY